MNSLLKEYKNVRKLTENICRPLEKEDYVVQPIADVSPPKWHLGHTTWFFEMFVLKAFNPQYTEFDTQYNFVFNSYYETIGARVLRTDRGNLSRPSVDDIYRYRTHIDSQMEKLMINETLDDALIEIIELGLQHEQQHQELLYTDIKYILGHNPLFPIYSGEKKADQPASVQNSFVNIKGGIYEIGYEGTQFCFDNELGRHQIYLNEFKISQELVTNGEYIDFIQDGGYENFVFWHAEGWQWVKEKRISAPLYWHFIDGRWMNYTFAGLEQVTLGDAICHISFYEASAFASWKQMRLPTEAEWEIAAPYLDWGKRWEWTGSAYLPYPGYQKAAGATGEYNGKFMVNQMVLRGASEWTSPGHSRISYRNFFHPAHQWQFTGIRLAY
jgi:ergothioneine biosynthesis protein EgtB